MRFSPEPCLRCRVEVVMGQQEFQCNRSSQLPVVRAIDDTHTACASYGRSALLERQITEVSVLQKPALSRTKLRETRERIVEIREALEIFVREFRELVEGQRSDTHTAFFSETRAGAIDEKIPHD